jgi:hypothetical protein
LVASAEKFSCRKFNPGRVTRTDAAFSIVLLFGKPPGRGAVPQDAHPLEHPPPLHDAMRSKSVASKTRLNRQERPGARGGWSGMEERLFYHPGPPDARITRGASPGPHQRWLSGSKSSASLSSREDDEAFASGAGRAS